MAESPVKLAKQTDHCFSIPMRPFPFIGLLLLAIFQANVAWACPDIAGFVDLNCDQKMKIVITGDSIVHGVGDIPESRNGYAGRLRQYFRGLGDIEIEELGINGVTTLGLFRGFRRHLLKDEVGRTKEATAGADAIMIDVGRNDYWDNIPPGQAARNVMRTVRFLQNELEDEYGSKPFIFVTTLIPTTRGFQSPFINSLNSTYLRGRSRGLPVELRLDSVNPERLDMFDGLHPQPRGYTFLARKVGRFLLSDFYKRSQAKRPDRDNDGVFDLFERNKYGTSPETADTDGDGISDGEEIFEAKTDPLVAEE